MDAMKEIDKLVIKFVNEMFAEVEELFTETVNGDKYIISVTEWEKFKKSREK